MGYELHITRAKNWWQSETVPISATEWQKLIDQDPALRPAVDVWSGSESDKHIPICFVGSGGSEEPLWFRSGRIDIKNPLPSSVGKLKQIAEALGARVLGDDGEEYDATGSIRPTVAGASTELVALVRQLCDALHPDRVSALLAFRELPHAQIRTAIEQAFLDISDAIPGALEADCPELVQALAEAWSLAEDLYAREGAAGSPAGKALVDAAAGKRGA